MEGQMKTGLNNFDLKIWGKFCGGYPVPNRQTGLPGNPRGLGKF